MNTDQWGIVHSYLDDPNGLNGVSKLQHQITQLRRDQLVYNYICGKMFPCQGPEPDSEFKPSKVPSYPYKTFFRHLYHFHEKVDDNRWLITPNMGRLLLWNKSDQSHFIHPPHLGFRRLLGVVKSQLIGLSSDGLLTWDLDQPTNPPTICKMELFDAAILRGGRLLLVKPNSIEIRDGKQTLTLKNVKKEHYKTWSVNTVGWECIKIEQHLFLFINNANELNCYNANTDHHLWTKKLDGIFSKIHTWHVKGEVRIGIGDQWFSFLPPSRKRKREEMERSGPTHLVNSK